MRPPLPKNLASSSLPDGFDLAHSTWISSVALLAQLVNQIFLDPNFVGPTFFLSPKFLHNKVLGKTFYLDPMYFWTQNILDPIFKTITYLDLNFLDPHFFGSKCHLTKNFRS